MMATAYINKVSTYPGSLRREAIRYAIRFSPTPLYMACYYSHLDIVELLLSHGAAANYPSPTSWMEHAASSTEIDYLLAWQYPNENEIQPDSFLDAFPDAFGMRVPVPSRISSWQLPIRAAMTGGHEAIVNLLLLSGALWPEEFDCFHGSHLRSLDSHVETLAHPLIKSLMTGSLPKTTNGISPST